MDGDSMSRSAQRQLALRICLAAIAWVTAAFFWISLVSFDPADPPSNMVFPANAQVANWCGALGATVSYALFYYFGAGAFALAALLTFAALAWSHARPLGDVWLRFLGLLLVVASVSAAGAASLPVTGFTVAGAGGLLGGLLHAVLLQNLQTLGAIIVLASSFLVGILLAADEVVLALTRWMGWVGQRSAPAVSKGGAALASAGKAVAQGVVNASARLSSHVGSANGNGNGSGNGSGAARRNGNGKAGGKRASSAANDDETDPDARRANGSSDARVDGAGPANSQWRDRSAPNAFAAAFQASLPLEPPQRRAKRSAELTDEAPLESADDLERSDDPDSSAIGPALAQSNSASEPLVNAARRMPVKDVTASPRPPKEQKEPQRSEPRPIPKAPYVLPPLNLLEDSTPADRQVVEMLCREKACILEQTLNEFRLEVQVVAIETGPVITVFELRLAPGIKVSQIASLANDMARALKAPAVRVVAPLPGKNTIGIEVPNVDKEKVRLKELIESAARSDSGLPIYLGKDASGQPLVLDLTKMPHGLIAGTTGSGKSVCVSSIIVSLLLTRTPDEVNLILVDPKVVELAMFKDIPHLMCPIVTEMSKAEAILDWAATKMDERYALLAEAGVKDIRAYNRLGHDELRERLQATAEEMQKVPVYLPYIVIMVDELADLMMTSAKEVEFYLCRLAQKSRAVGIHLIVSTQRPQANVVTGLIKSNLPCRIAFRVSSRLDSRIVLDQNGAEVLMGQGDMLLLPPGSAKLVRAQGTFVSDEELKRVVKHCREQRQPDFHPELVRMPSASAAGESERDELFDQAVDIVLETGRGSVSLLQRRLTIGYGRASRLIDQMYEAGIVGEYKGSQAREVVLSKDEWAAIRGQRDREEAEEAAG